MIPLLDQFLAQINVIADSPSALFAVMLAASLGNAVFPPIPIEFATLFAGYLVSTGHGSLAVIIFATTLGMSVGSAALYFAARAYGASLLRKEPFRRIILPGTRERASLWFQKYGVIALFLAKLVPGMNFCAVLCSGVLRLSRAKALTGIFLSNIFAFGSLAFIGKTAGEHWRQVYAQLGKAGTLLLVLAGSAVFVVIYLRSLASRRRN